MESGRLRGSGNSACALRTHLASRHRSLQQVSWFSVTKMTMKISDAPLLFAQRRRELRGDDNDQSYSSSYRESCVETSGHLQIVLRNRRRIFPFRRTDLLHEIRIVDVRRLHGIFFS